MGCKVYLPGLSSKSKGLQILQFGFRKKITSMDVTFFVSVPFFLSSKASLQMKQNSEESLLCLPPFLPHSFHPSVFNNWSFQESRKNLLVYLRREKDTVSTSPHWSSLLNQGNIQSQPESEDDHDLHVALQKVKRSCTNHPVSNFVS